MRAEAQWGRWLTEGLVIVISILLAFAIDAWWDERAEAVAERRSLDQFIDEMDLYERLLGQADETTRRAISATETLLDAIHTQSPMEAGAFEASVREITYMYHLGEATPTFDRLLSAGNLGQLGSADLRRSLANLGNLLGVLRRFENLESEFLEHQLRPYLVRHVDLYRIRPPKSDDPEPPASRFEGQSEEILDDREFSNLLLERIRYARGSQVFRRQVSEELERARAALLDAS